MLSLRKNRSLPIVLLESDVLPSGKNTKLIENCQQHGIEWARWMASQYSCSPHTAHMAADIYKWINEQERAAEILRNKQTKDAIDQAKRSAFWTMVAAWVAAASVIIPLFNKAEPQKVIIQVQTQPQPVTKPAAVTPHQNK